MQPYLEDERADRRVKDPGKEQGSTGADPYAGEQDDSDAQVEEKATFTLPDDYDDEYSFVKDAVEFYNNDVTADLLNTEAMVDDFRFMVGDQWDATQRAQRLGAQKPVLTINRLPAFVAQVVGNRLLNETVIKVVPDKDGTKAVARVREGLIRNIEKVSRASDAYDTALKNSVIGGLGNFALELDYATYDVFEQDIRVIQLPDPCAVVWDHLSIEATGRDARHVFVEERMSRKLFKEKYPDASPTEFGGDASYYQQLTMTGWITEDTVRIVSYWRMRSEDRAIMLDGMTGKVVDVTDMIAGGTTPQQIAQLAAKRADGTPYFRIAKKPYAEMYTLTAMNILEGPYKLPISRVPVFRVPGWEIFIGEDRHRFGLIRFAKDPQRVHNYWRSIIVEKLMQTPKAKWIASKEAVQGQENKWRNSHLTDDPLLIWNGESGQAPQEVKPAQIEPALIQEANMATQDIKDVLNMHEASLGMTSNEVSGKALDRRQRVSELGTVIYFSNLNNSIEECGRTINELIPETYDTARTITTLGPDGAADLQKINQEGGVDILIGKYGISVTTGPSYTTKRVEAVESMMAMSNNMPNIMANAADIMVENMDWPGAEKVAKRLKASLPPGIAQTDPEDMTDEEKQFAAQAAQKAQMMEALSMKDMELELAKKDAEIARLRAQTAEHDARAQQARSAAVKNIADAEATAAGVEMDEARTQMEIARTLDELNAPEETDDDDQSTDS